jgi:probable rRNA maturation factor
MRDISVANRHPRLRFPRGSVRRLVETLDAHQAEIGVPSPAFLAGELSLAFLTDRALARLHGAFLRDPTTTDVITFEGDAALGAAGEICVSVDTALAYARAHRHDFATELALYVVHGWLHLAGYDDLVPEKKRAMRRAEARALRALRRTGAIPDFTLR